MSTVLSKLYPTINIDENDLHNNVDQLRDLRDQFNELMLIDTATFFTDKLLTLTSDDKNEVYNMAKLLYEKEEFQRAAFFITSRNLHQNDLSCRYLAAKCYVCFSFYCNSFLRFFTFSLILKIMKNRWKFYQ